MGAMFSGQAIDGAISHVFGEVPDEHDHVEVEFTTIDGGVAGAVTFRKSLGDGWVGDAALVDELKNSENYFGVRMKLSKRLGA